VPADNPAPVSPNPAHAAAPGRAPGRAAAGTRVTTRVLTYGCGDVFPRQAGRCEPTDLVGADAGKGWRQGSGLEPQGCSVPAEAPAGPRKVPSGREAEPAPELRGCPRLEPHGLLTGKHGSPAPGRGRCQGRAGASSLGSSTPGRSLNIT